MDVDKIPIDSKPPEKVTAERAAIIQSALRQKHELYLLSAIESLLDLPTSPSPSPSPSDTYPTRPDDVSLVKRHFESFTPKDFDDLVEERNISYKCGFVLCDSVPPNAKGGGVKPGKLKMTSGGKLVELRSLGRYCGEGCARQALYLRVQLDEESGWMRKGGDGMGVTMLEEEEEEDNEDTEKEKEEDTEKDKQKDGS